MSNLTEAAGDDGGEDDELAELVMITEDYYYLNPCLRFLAVLHSMVAFAMLVAYYCLKVS